MKQVYTHEYISPNDTECLFATMGLLVHGRNSDLPIVLPQAEFKRSLVYLLCPVWLYPDEGVNCLEIDEDNFSAVQFFVKTCSEQNN